jgi:hypothetical protein
MDWTGSHSSLFSDTLLGSIILPLALAVGTLALPLPDQNSLAHPCALHFYGRRSGEDEHGVWRVPSDLRAPSGMRRALTLQRPTYVATSYTLRRINPVVIDYVSCHCMADRVCGWIVKVLCAVSGLTVLGT